MSKMIDVSLVSSNSTSELVFKVNSFLEKLDEEDFIDIKFVIPEGNYLYKAFITYKKDRPEE